jgi:hypothetical protein
MSSNYISAKLQFYTWITAGIIALLFAFGIYTKYLPERNTPKQNAKQPQVTHPWYHQFHD